VIYINELDVLDMKITEFKDKLVLEQVADFDVGQTLECGQCFNFEKLKENEYVVLALGHLLHIKQVADTVTMFNTTLDEYELIWKNYFDLDRDYGDIKRTLKEADELLVPAIDAKWGVHILNQEFSENLMSFIISQTKQITQIKQIVRMISEKFGEFAGEIDGKKYYLFPEISVLKNMTQQDFLDCKTGFRAPYLVNAAAFLTPEMNGEYFSSKTYEEAKKELLSIKGVGEKVANCVLLFSLGYRNAFPVDVWIKRTMEDLYFHKDTRVDIIQKFGEERFGDLGGYAQQYLFYYGKSK